MDFWEFKRQVQGQAIIRSRDVVRGFDKPQAMLNQLTRWQKRGLLVPLRKGIYVLNPDDRKIEAEPAVIANALYEPSYVSLEYALNFYGLIPEAVKDVTCVSTRKTAKFDNPLGTFRYQHIHPKAFRGFKKVGAGQGAFFIAEAEKAVVDFLYLNSSRFQGSVRDVLERSYRFQNIRTLKPVRLNKLALSFENVKLSRIVKELAA